MTEEIRVYRKHLRQIKFCSSKSALMAEQLGIDWEDFTKNGVPISRLENVDDINVKRLVEHVKGQENGK